MTSWSIRFIGITGIIAKTFFIDELVHVYFVNKKLKDLSEEEFESFVKHSENPILSKIAELENQLKELKKLIK